MNRVLAALAICMFPLAAFALDSADQGVYAIVHLDGHVTDFLFRVSHERSAWKVERQGENGTWEDVSCEAECVLRLSSAADLTAMFGLGPEALSAECIQNTAFAFCRVPDGEAPHSRSYAFFGFVDGETHRLRLKKVK